MNSAADQLIIDMITETWEKFTPVLKQAGGMPGILLRSIMPEVPDLIKGLSTQPEILLAIRGFVLAAAERIRASEEVARLPELSMKELEDEIRDLRERRQDEIQGPVTELPHAAI